MVIKKGFTALSLPLPSCMSSGHVFPPLSGGLTINLNLNLVPVASGALQLVQSPTIHGNGTEINIQILI